MFHRLMAYLNIFRSNPAPIVAVVRLTGIIAPSGRLRQSLNLANTARLLARAFGIYGVKAVALSINSPGGSPVQSALIMQRVRDLASEKNVPVLTFAEDVAASGGYMLALAGDEIFAHEASIVGSIGVISAGFGFPEAISKLGIERRIYTAGEKKALLDPFSEEKEEDVARLKELQGQMHEYFKGLVKERRGRKLKATKGAAAKIFSGDVWLARDAEKLGLIDGIGDLRGILRERFGENVKIKMISQKKTKFAGLLGLAQRFGGAGDTGDAGDTGWADDLLGAVEARLFWSRYGL
ncbi:MAG: S49 family peptidase [Proteobacteria bacterium]|nr:S49 family peptidase [Pseudomonadota bacterium]